MKTKQHISVKINKKERANRRYAKRMYAITKEKIERKEFARAILNFDGTVVTDDWYI